MLRNRYVEIYSVKGSVFGDFGYKHLRFLLPWSPSIRANVVYYDWSCPNIVVQFDASTHNTHTEASGYRTCYKSAFPVEKLPTTLLVMEEAYKIINLVLSRSSEALDAVFLHRGK